MQLNSRERRNRYLYQLATLTKLADITGVEVSQLVRYLDRLRQANQLKEALRIQQQTAISEDIQ
jgi:hypothetical protein